MFDNLFLMNPEFLRDKIQKTLKDKNVSIRQMERMSGLGPTSLRHFLSGRTNNPKLETIRSIAKALNMDVSELTNEDVNDKILPFSNQPWEKTIFLKIASNISDLIENHKPNISNEEAMTIIRNLYYFCYERKNEDLEKNFKEGLFKEIIQKK